MGIYIAIRFEPRFGLGAAVALLHDVIVAVAALAFAGMEFDLTTVAALLTIVGYSVNDTVIVSDRIRENMRKNRRESLGIGDEPEHQRDAEPDDPHGRHGDPRRPRVVLPRRRGHPRLRVHAARRRDRRHVLLDLHREPDRPLSRPQAPRARQGGREGARNAMHAAGERASREKRTTQRWVASGGRSAPSRRRLGGELGVRRCSLGCWSTAGGRPGRSPTTFLGASLARRPALAACCSARWLAQPSGFSTPSHGERIAIYGDYDVDGISGERRLRALSARAWCEPTGAHPAPHEGRLRACPSARSARSARGERLVMHRGLRSRGARGDRGGDRAPVSR